MFRFKILGFGPLVSSLGFGFRCLGLEVEGVRVLGVQGLVVTPNPESFLVQGFGRTRGWCPWSARVSGPKAFSRFQVPRFRVQGPGSRVHGPGSRDQDAELRVQGPTFRVEGSGFESHPRTVSVEGA